MASGLSPVLPIVGAFVLAVALVVLITKRQSQLLTASQKFSGFGVSLEVTLLAVLLVVGTMLCSSGAVLHILDNRERLSKAATQIEELRQRLAQTEGLIEGEVTPVLVLEGIPVNTPPEDLRFQYTIAGEGRKRVLPIETAFDVRQYKVRLTGIKRASIIEAMQVVDSKTKAVWQYKQQFVPLSPTFELSRIVVGQGDGDRVSSTSPEG